MIERIKNFVPVVLELCKFRIILANAVSASAGYFLGKGDLSLKFIYIFFGILLLAGGASILNQIIERDTDSIMVRTRGRPLPARKISLRSAYLIFLVFTMPGIFLTHLADVKAMTVALGAFVIYDFIYTPLKRITKHSLFVGALVGSLPPLAGYLAAQAQDYYKIFIFCSFMYLYQIPHTLSLFYIFREDWLKTALRTFAELEAHKLKRIILGISVPTIILGLATVWVSSYQSYQFKYSIFSVIFFSALAFWVLIKRDIRSIFVRLNIFMIAVSSFLILSGILY